MSRIIGAVVIITRTENINVQIGLKKKDIFYTLSEKNSFTVKTTAKKSLIKS